MNIKKALQTIRDKSKQGEDVTEDLDALIEAIDIEEQIGKLSAKLEKTVEKFNSGAGRRGRPRKGQLEGADLVSFVNTTGTDTA